MEAIVTSDVVEDAMIASDVLEDTIVTSDVVEDTLVTSNVLEDVIVISDDDEDAMITSEVLEDTVVTSDVLENAKRYELQKFEENKTMFLELSALDIHLNNIYETHRPSSQEYDVRRDLVRIFNEIAREIYGNNKNCPVVKEFGSFAMDLFNARCDLDLSINFYNEENYHRLPNTKTLKKAKTKILRKFSKKLSQLQNNGHVTDVQLISTARVPVLKVTDSGTRVECDISVGNLDGIVNSQIISMISAIDERFRKLCVLMKLWAKANEINSARDGTINSYSLILLVAFHLQTRDIPILPPFSAILKDGLDLEAVNKNVQELLNYGERNKETLAELFVSMFIKLEAVNPLWLNGLCASTYEGSWISKKLGCVSIEDFSNRSQNTSRALHHCGMGKILACIRHSIEQIRLFTEHKIDQIELKNNLFQEKPKLTNELALNILSFLGKTLQPAEGDLAKSVENSAIPKKCSKNITASDLSYIDRVGKGNLTSARSENECSENITALGPSNAGRVETSKTSTSNDGIDKLQESVLGNPKKICPENSRYPTLSNVGRVGIGNAHSTCHGGIVKSQESLLRKHKKRRRRNINAPTPSNIGRDGTSNVTTTSHGEVIKSQESLLGNPKKRCLGNINPPTPPNIGGAGTSNVTSTSQGGLVKSHESLLGNTEKRCPAYFESLGPSKVGQVAPNNVTLTSHGGMQKPQESLTGVCNQLRQASNTFQLSGGHQFTILKPPNSGYGAIRADNPQNWTYGHSAPSFMPGHPFSGSIPPFQSSSGYGHNASSQFPASQEFVGYRPKISPMDHFTSAPNFLNPGGYLPGSRPTCLTSACQPQFHSAPYGLNRPLPPAQSGQSWQAPGYRGIPGHQPNLSHGNQPPYQVPRF